MPESIKAPAWRAEFVLLAAVWGSSFLFMRIASVDLGIWPTVGLRVGIGALCLVPLVFLQGYGSTLRKYWKTTFAVGVTNSAIPFACFVFALQYLTIGLTSVLNACVPMFGALVAWVWLKDKPNGSRMLGLAIGFTGVTMLAWDKIGFGTSSPATGNPWGPTWGVLACLFACVCYALSASFTKRYIVGLPSIVSATGSQLGATLVLLPLTLGYWPSHPVALKAYAATVALGVMCTALAYVLYFRLIERAGPSKSLSVTFAIPVFAVFYGVVLLGETVTPWMLICAAVVVLGTSLSSGLWQVKLLQNK